jgi:hypothetical protein
VALLTVVAACGGDESAPGETPPPAGEKPEAVLAAKAGTYEGNWEIFARAADGTVQSAMTWTDVAVADRPTIESERAYLHVVDNMTLAGGMQMTQEWIEGVLVEPDGTAGKQFIEMNGAVTVLEEIEPHHYQYETEIEDTDYYFIEGVTPGMVVAGHHAIDKVVTFPGDKETHSIHRTTHLEWSDAMGNAQTDEWESLTGTHVKTQ